MKKETYRSHRPNYIASPVIGTQIIIFDFAEFKQRSEVFTFFARR